MKKQILSIISILLFGFSIVLAQTSEPKTISGGVVNGKARTLAKPAYPAAAKAVNASGSVNVQVTIDENGDVVSASAVSGHPLLRAAAEQAARESKFSPTLLQGQPVKVTGVIIYNFVADKANWFKVGYDLTSLQFSPSLMFLNTNSIAEIFQADWSAEREQLKRLAEIKQTESSNISQPIIIGERKISENTEKKPDGTTVKTITTERTVKSGNQINPEQIAISQSLIASLQSRLASDELNLWQFNLGSGLSQALSQARNPNERQRTLDSLRQQIQSAPDKVSTEYLAEVQKVITILEKQNLSADDRQEIGQIMPKLFRNQ
ncbi:MAG: TonB family protein [Pyrinomonadaceae bacterium]